MTTSPAPSLTGGGSEVTAQLEPLATMWNSITCSVPGITASAISRPGGASADHSSPQLT